jgi:IclR family transcriptional regulator, acetate operon repressor
MSNRESRSTRKAAIRQLAPKQGSRRSGNVQALTRALSIMKAVAAQDRGATLTEVARATKLAPSTVHRLLTTLQQDRFVQFESEGARWLVGVEAFVVGRAFLQARDIARVAPTFLRRLMEQSAETANLAILDEDMAVYMGQVESRQTMRAICKLGGRVFLHSSALGKSMLALMEPEEVGRILAAKGMTRLTQRTLDNPTRLAAQLTKVRIAGYAADDEEYSPGLRCVAAAVTDEYGGPVGALSISGPTIRVTRERLEELGLLVRSIADELTLELGGKVCAPAGKGETLPGRPETSTMRKIPRRSRPRGGRDAA